MAVTFRRADLAAASGSGVGGGEEAGAAASSSHQPAWLRGGLLSREQARALSMADRLALVAQGLLLYSRWYKMPAAAALPLPLVQ